MKIKSRNCTVDMQWSCETWRRNGCNVTHAETKSAGATQKNLRKCLRPEEEEPRCKRASGIRGMACSCTFFGLCAHRVHSHTFVGPPTAFLRRGTDAPWVSLLGPTTVPSGAQGSTGCKALTLCHGCCCEVEVVVVVCLFTTRSRVSRNTYTPARWSALAQACHRLCPRNLL